jgi:formylglycine-generating enzyme required for sulfatase activity
MLRRGLLSLALLLCMGAAAATDNPFVRVPGADFHSALPPGGQQPGGRQPASQQAVHVPDFLLQRHPVTNGEFLAFLITHPQWQRGAVPAVMADARYLASWPSSLDPGPPPAASQPVTQVSWFAAQAYCEAEHARLPDWYEWELAAAASASARDARSDQAWRQQVLDWYARPAEGALSAVEQGTPNVYGLHDLHGLVWEWVRDFNSLLPADADPEKFCGSGALDLQQKENYAVLMRIAMLGSLRAAYTGRILGFRCARDVGDAP